MATAANSMPTPGASQGKSGGRQTHPEQPAQNIPQKTRKSQKKLRRKDVREEPVAGSSKSSGESQWMWRSLTESSASKVPLLFTKDSSYFFSASGTTIKIYATITGHVVSTLSTNSEPDLPSSPSWLGDSITCMALNPHNPFQLIVGSADGHIRVWDFLDAILLRIFDVGLPVLHLAVHEKFKDEVFVAVARPTKKVNSNGNTVASEDNGSVLRVTLKPSEATSESRIQKPSVVISIGKTRSAAGLTISPSGSWLVAIAGHKAYVAQTSDLKAGFTKFISPERLKCLAFHPTEEYFATGDDRGVVRLWYCLNELLPAHITGTEKKAPTTTLHWHAHAVSALAFSTNGAYLLSGGEETVLVIWQLHTGKKEYVPRVGAPIVNLAVCQAKDRDEEYLLGLADASFVFVRSGTLKLGRFVARIKLDPTGSSNRISSIPLAIHPVTSTLILPSSHPSSLQSYSPSSHKLLSELEVSPSNRVSRRDDKPLEPSRVEKAVISDTGAWMATIDSRIEEGAHKGEIHLKIWSWDKATGSWVLNTRIDKPHGPSKVTSISFRPKSGESSNIRLITTGEDGQIKLWRLRSIKRKDGGIESYWVALSSVRYQSEIPTHAAWSADGSLLAVSFGPYVVLYDPDTSILLKTLTYPECTSISSVYFVGRGSRYLAAVSEKTLVLWDLVTHRALWQYQSSHSIKTVVPHPREDTLLVLKTPPVGRGTTPSTRCVTFKALSSTPVEVKELPFHLHSVVRCPSSWTTLDSNPSAFSLVGITTSWSVVLIGNNVKYPVLEGSEPRGIRGDAPITKRTIFQDIFGTSAFTGNTLPSSPSVIPSSSPWKGKEIERVLDAPAYLIPPLTTLFDPLMADFLTPRLSTPGEAKDHEPEAEVDDMDVDADGDDGPIIVGNRLERIVDRDEMDVFVQLFMKHAISTPSSSNATPNGIYTNGIHKSTAHVNGTASSTPQSTPRINGSKNKSKSTPIPSKATAISTPIPSHAEESSPVRTGQKRKKSSGAA